MSREEFRTLHEAARRPFFSKLPEKPVFAGFFSVVSEPCVQRCFGKSPMSANRVDRDPDEISRNSVSKKSGFAPARRENFSVAVTIRVRLFYLRRMLARRGKSNE
jgi:hypothetical protein